MHHPSPNKDPSPGVPQSWSLCVPRSSGAGETEPPKHPRSGAKTPTKRWGGWDPGLSPRISADEAPREQARTCDPSRHPLRGPRTPGDPATFTHPLGPGGPSEAPPCPCHPSLQRQRWRFDGISLRGGASSPKSLQNRPPCPPQPHLSPEPAGCGPREVGEDGAMGEGVSRAP